MFYGIAYGLCLRSDISLGGAIPLVDCSNKVDVEIQRGLPKLSDLSVESVLTRGSIPGIARFCIQDGLKIFYEPEAGVSDLVLGPCLLGSAMSVLLRQRGLLVLHAGCLNRGDGEALGMMGHSGWGKSTLVSALGERGYQLLSDDVLPIKFEDDEPYAIPSFPHVKLLPDAAKTLGYSVSSMTVLHERTPKLDHSIVNQFGVSNLPLKQLYILNWSDTISVEILSPKQAFLALLAYSRAARSVIEPEFRQQHFELCTRLTQTIPIYRFNRPKDFSTFEESLVYLETSFEMATAA